MIVLLFGAIQILISRTRWRAKSFSINHETDLNRNITRKSVDRILVVVLNRLHASPQNVTVDSRGWTGMKYPQQASSSHKARIIPPVFPARTVDELNGKASRLNLRSAGREDLIALRRAFESRSRKRSRNNAPFCLRVLISLGQISNLELVWKRSRCIALTSM